LMMSNYLNHIQNQQPFQYYYLSKSLLIDYLNFYQIYEIFALT
jgi:hypothetical protein